MFDFDLIKNKRVLVHCPDKDIAISFVEAYREKFPGKYFRGHPGDDEYWHVYGKNTCYIPNLNVNDSLKYVNYQVFKDKGYVVLPVGELLQCVDVDSFEPSEDDIKSLFGME